MKTTQPGMIDKDGRETKMTKEKAAILFEGKRNNKSFYSHTE